MTSETVFKSAPKRLVELFIGKEIELKDIDDDGEEETLEGTLIDVESNYILLERKDDTVGLYNCTSIVMLRCSKEEYYKKKGVETYRSESRQIKEASGLAWSEKDL